MIRTTTYDDTLYQLVPILPTQEMIDNARWEDGEETARNVWAAMLSAAPTPPAQPAERKPLTIESIKSMDYRGTLDEHTRAVRMTEAAHGIKGES